MRKNNFKLIVLLLFVLMFVIGCNGQGTDETGDDTDVDTTPPTSLFIYPLSDAWDVDLDTLVKIGFSEPLESYTVSAGSFLMMSGSLKKVNEDLPRQPIIGTVGYDETSYIATFTPNADLAPNTIYTVLVTGAITDLAGNRFGFTPWEFITVRLLKVTYTSPYNGATDVALNATIVASFSEQLNQSTVNTATFTLSGVIGDVNLNDNGTTAIFKPDEQLTANTTYTATLTTGITDLDGNAMQDNYVWTFETGTTVDNIPTVSNVNPADGATDVPVNTSIKAEFSEPLNEATVTDETFILSDGDSQVNGTVSYSGTTATFTPSGNLTLDVTYTATLTTGIEDLAGNNIESVFEWSFTIAADFDETPPIVSLVSPANNADAVAPNTAIVASFSEPLDATTVNTVTFILEDTSEVAAPVQVTGTVTYSGTTATFTPESLSDNTTYTATLTAGIADVAGNTLVSNYAWSFETGQKEDTTAPTVISTVPGLGDPDDIATNASISATFSEPMDAATITTTSFTVSIDGSEEDILGTVTYSGTTATFTPNSNLANTTTYTAKIKTSVTDLAGINLADPFEWSFTTTNAPDEIPPFVIVNSVIPSPGATGVGVGSNMRVDFSEPMDASTITTATFTVILNGAFPLPVAGTVSYSGTTATFNPSTNLAFNTTYTATITTGATDLAGNALPTYSWTFTTQQGRGGMN